MALKKKIMPILNKSTASQDPNPKIVAESKSSEIAQIDSSDRIELERKEAYIEPKTRDLLRQLLQCCEKDDIIPVYDPNIGFVYNIAGKADNSSQTMKVPRLFLQNLARLDILSQSFYDAVATCPNCQSTIVTLHNRCPKCRSHNIEKTSLTEHIPCGFINQRSKYVNDRCPKCGAALIEGEFRNMGRWYVCRDCSERFENPESDLVCRSCSKVFSVKEAQVLEIPKFALNEARKKEIRQNVASLENISDLLTDMGFSVEIPGLATGQKSGMQHHFSLMAKKQVKDREINIALDHAVSESEVTASPLILYIYKLSEVKVDIPVFVAMPSLNETARKIAQGHEILLIEGSTEGPDFIGKIRKDIEDRVGASVAEAEGAKKKKDKGTDPSLFGKLTGLIKK